MKRHKTTLPSLIACALMLTSVVPAFAAEGEPCPGEAGECVEAMMKKLSQRGWVGINMDENDGRVVLSAVVPDSPAEAAGLEAGDVLISVNGLVYSEADPKQIKETYQGFKPGDETVIVASRDGVEDEYVVTLGKLPQHILAQWVGYHMIEGHGGYEEAEEATVEAADK